MVIRKNLLSKRLVRHWHRLSPCLETFQNHGDVALMDVVTGHGGGGLGLDMGISEVSSNIKDSVILRP